MPRTVTIINLLLGIVIIALLAPTSLTSFKQALPELTGVAVFLQFEQPIPLKRAPV